MDTQPLRIRTNNVERMRLLADGKLGLGTTNPKDAYALSGKAAGVEGSIFVLAVYKDAASMHIGMPGLPDLQIRSLPSGKLLIAEQSPAPANGCKIAPPIPAQGIEEPSSGEPSEEPVTLPSRGKVRRLNEANVVDILMFTTPQATSALGGVNAAISTCMSSLTFANQVHVNSHTNAQLNLVGVKTDFVLDESGSYDDVLSRFRADTETSDLRDLYQADLCCLLISRTDGNTHGTGSLFQSDPVNLIQTQLAFSVSYCHTAASRVVAYETGHNFGCGHAPNDPNPQGFFDYSHGHNHGDGAFVWIYSMMSYNRGAIYESAMPYYSEPGTYHETSPGVTWETGTADRNNAETIRSTGFAVTLFRRIDADLYVYNLSTAVEENGSKGAPFRSLSKALSVALDGATFHIKGPRNYSDKPRITKSIHLRNWDDLGNARLGAQ